MYGKCGAFEGKRLLRAVGSCLVLFYYLVVKV